jgi:hypothetical protein
MFLVEKDIVVEPSVTLINNATNLVAGGTIASIIDTDRHKFETFADALWWGIVCYNYLIDFLVSIKFFVFL